MAGTLSLELEGGDVLTFTAPAAPALAFVSNSGAGGINMNGITGPQGMRGPAGPPGSAAVFDDLPDFTLIFDNRLI